MPALPVLHGSDRDRPTKLREWMYALSVILRAVGPEVLLWWDWAVAEASAAHARYLVTPVLSRGGVVAFARTPARWAQIEGRLQGHVLAAVPR